MDAKNPEKPPRLLGIDAGGTKTQAWLAQLISPGCQTVHDPHINHGQLEIMGIGNSGPANVRSVGAHQAAVMIAEAIGDALKDSKLRATEVDAIWIGAAGAATPAVANELRTVLEKQLASNRLHVSGDIDLVIAAAQATDCSGDRTGHWTNTPLLGDFHVSRGTVIEVPPRRRNSVLAVIAGTGSVVFGHEPIAAKPEPKDPTSVTYSAGGWGPLVGDLGSGLWFGAQVLQAACQAVDGSGPPTVLLSRVLKHFKINDPRALPAVLLQSGTANQNIAGLTPLLADVVDHDEVARKIVDQGVADLVRQVNAVFQKLKCPIADLRVALAGSVLTKSDFVSTRLLAALEPIGLASRTNPALDRSLRHSGTQHGDHSRPQVMRILHPVYGALVLAAEAFEETSTNSIGTSTHCP